MRPGMHLAIVELVRHTVLVASSIFYCRSITYFAFDSSPSSGITSACAFLFQDSYSPLSYHIHCLLTTCWPLKRRHTFSNPIPVASPPEQAVAATQLRCDIVPSRPPSTSLRQEISTFHSTTLPSTTPLRALLHHHICSLDLIVARSSHRHIPQIHTFI
jgi:hypothetical protein